MAAGYVRETGWWQRVRAIRRERGWLGLGARVLARGGEVTQAAWRRLARHRNHVFVHPGAFGDVREPEGFSAERYAGRAEIPPAVVAELQAAFGERSFTVDEWELARHAVLWLARIDGRLCGASMNRRGRHYRRWFVPLRPEDIVIYRNRTLAGFRGRGVCPALMRRVIEAELVGSPARAYVDCRVTNGPSIRSIEKAGFRRIATRRPLTSKQALGAGDR